VDTIRNSKDAPIDKSNALKIRLTDAFENNLIENTLAGPIKRVANIPADKSLSMMKKIDGVMAEATWRAAYRDASRNKTLSEGQKIRLADEAVVRTQGSGFVGDLSPIQMNAVGKALTLWQTYTINQMNWIAKEVMDMAHPERTPAETFRRVSTFLIGTAAINTLFEDVAGIQSPSPAPIKAIMKALNDGDSAGAAALKGMLEMTEVIPIMSNLKYGSSLGGAAIEAAGDFSKMVSEDLGKSLNGDKKAMQRVAFMLATVTGRSGTGQVKKIVEGVQQDKTLVQTLLGGQKETGGLKRAKRSPRVGRRSDRGSRSRWD
jgi:hypothetical protein